MSIFSKDLPLTISTGNEKIQGQFVSLSKAHIAIRVIAGLEKLQNNQEVEVSFLADKFDLRFEAQVVQKKEDVLIVTKPKEIKKKKHREATRLTIYLPITFSLWERSEQHEGKIVNLSSSGFKLLSPVRLNKQQLLTINTYLSDGDHKIMLRCQAVVVWCRLGEEKEFICGVTFTTLSHDAMAKIDEYVEHTINKPLPNNVDDLL